MQREFPNHPEQNSYPEFIAHLEIDYLEEQAVLPEQVSFSEFFPLDEMNNNQEIPPEKRRKPFWLFQNLLARIIVILCSLVLFATMLLRYPVHVTFQLRSVDAHSAALNLRMTVLQDSASDTYYQVTDYNEGLSVALSALLEGDNPISLQNLKPDTVYFITILRGGEKIRGFFFNTLPFQGEPPEELPPKAENTPQAPGEPEQQEPAEIPEEDTNVPVEEPPATVIIPVYRRPAQETEEGDTPPAIPPAAPPVIIVIPAATGPVNPLSIRGIYGGDAPGWSIVVQLLNSDTGGAWAPTEQDEGTVMIDWQLRDDLGNVVANGTTSYEEMMNQLGIVLPGSVPSGSYAVDVQVNFVNTDNITTQLDSLDDGYSVEDYIQSRPTNLPTDVTITQTDSADPLELIYQYLWEQAVTDEGSMNGGYWYMLDMSNRNSIGYGSIDNSQLGTEIPVTVPDGVTTVGVYFSPQYENQGNIYTVDEATAFKEITLPDTGQTFRLFLLQPNREEPREEVLAPAEETITPIEETASEEAASLTEDTVSEETTTPTEDTVSEETTTPTEDTVSIGAVAPTEETASEETAAPIEEAASEEAAVPTEEAASVEAAISSEEAISEEAAVPTEEAISEEAAVPTEQASPLEDTAPAQEAVDPNNITTE